MTKDKVVLKSLKEQILETLANDGLSISAILRALEKKGIKVHRLFLGGYLSALSDMNILKEKYIKPSKVFTITTMKEKTIYDMIKSYVSDHPDSTDLALYILYKIFKRPILKYELDKCGVARPNNAEKVFGEARKEALAILEKQGITVPKNMPAYKPKREFKEEFEDIILQIIIQKYNLSPYIPNKKIQMKIDVI